MDAFFGSEESIKLAPPLKVSQLVSLLKNDIERTHKNIRVVGEIASFKQWQSGHCYFDIKDEHALIPAVMFRPHFSRLAFQVKDGLEILFTGRVSVYAANARLQMVVEDMEPLGQGALALAFLQLKEKLAKKGLFDPAGKKNIKLLNKNIGIVTSMQGAALRDMVRIIKNRCPSANIMLASTRVQGIGAKEEIKSALERLDRLNLDVIIIGRGGGSLEDLWAFNEELVAEAIFAAQTPIISAVGHETDTTISDFVADVRAATPSHAAMLATPILQEIIEELSKTKQAFYDRQFLLLSKNALRLAEQKKRIKDPRILLFRHWQRVDDACKRITQNIERLFKNQHNILSLERQKLHNLAPFRQLALKSEALLLAKTSLDNNIYKLLKAKRSSYEQKIIKLEALSPLKVLSRGFGVVKNLHDGRVLTTVAQVKIKDSVSIRLHDGLISARVTDIKYKE
jgi:exodeoxyribonuclease VII large subunit